MGIKDRLTQKLRMSSTRERVHLSMFLKMHLLATRACILVVSIE